MKRILPLFLAVLLMTGCTAKPTKGEPEKASDQETVTVPDAKVDYSPDAPELAEPILQEQPEVPISDKTAQKYFGDSTASDIAPAAPAAPIEASEPTEQPVSEAIASPVSEPVTETTSLKSSGVYVGSVDSDKYHNPSCRFAEEILPENEIWFDSTEDAESSGYSPCGGCHPK
jgi:hypothetical protein